MIVPDALLEVLSCSCCDAYLSRGPVYLKHNGVAVCGRCYAPEDAATRNTQYEAAAKLLKFPCKYRELGCPVTVPFVAETEEIEHEAGCVYRQYICPVFGFDRCDWLGTRLEILEHCRTKHFENVVENPATLIHDISRPSVQTFLLSAFEVLFLLHTKVCLTSAKIFHSVRYLGGSEKSATKFHFTLNVQRGGEQLMKIGQVASQGCMAIQEDTSSAVDTNSLLIVLGGFDGARFTVTVKRQARQAEKQTRTMETCEKCGIEMAEYYDNFGWRCKCCAPARLACENKSKGCLFNDLDKKCKKHEWFFCKQRTQCEICRKTVPVGSLFSHYSSAHDNKTYKVDFTWRATNTGKDGQHCFLLSTLGTAVCAYWLDDDEFKLWVWSPVSSEQLHEYNCEVQLTCPDTGYTQMFTTDTLYHIAPDWQFRIYKDQLWRNKIDVCVYIHKI